MKTNFAMKLGDSEWATAEVSIGAAGDHHIVQIDVPRAYRNKGIGKQLLMEILTAADEEGITLQLNCVSSDEQGLSDRELADWYAKFGFVLTTNDFMLRMKREPRGRSARGEQ
jgi:GNAT superfamily N-acetyltransferase